MKKWITIIIGIPTQENIDKAHKIAVALGLGWDKLYRDYLVNNYPKTEVSATWKRDATDKVDMHGPHKDGGTIHTGSDNIDLRPIIKQAPRLSVKLNSEYTAVIEGDDVVVGCRRFPSSKVLELAKLIEGGSK